MFRPTKTEFICTKCKTHEFIPTDIVLQLDAMDPGDPSYPPTFYCEKCNGLMKPIGIEKYKNTYKIIYKCSKCNQIHKNIMAQDDNYDLIVKLSVSEI